MVSHVHTLRGVFCIEQTSRTALEFVSIMRSEIAEFCTYRIGSILDYPTIQELFINKPQVDP